MKAFLITRDEKLTAQFPMTRLRAANIEELVDNISGRFIAATEQFQIPSHSKSDRVFPPHVNVEPTTS